MREWLWVDDGSGERPEWATAYQSVVERSTGKRPLEVETKR